MYSYTDYIGALFDDTASTDSTDTGTDASAGDGSDVAPAALVSLGGDSGGSDTSTEASSDTSGQTFTVSGGGAGSAFGVGDASLSTVLSQQQALKQVGFDPGPLDGIRGPKTIAAIRAFQQAEGLSVDGIFGPLTTAKMQDVIATGDVPSQQEVASAFAASGAAAAVTKPTPAAVVVAPPTSNVGTGKKVAIGLAVAGGALAVGFGAYKLTKRRKAA